MTEGAAMYDDDDNGEPTGRTIAEYRPTHAEMPDAIARLRLDVYRDRRARASLRKLIVGASVSVAITVVVSGGTVAIRVGQYIEQLATTSRDIAAVTQRLERIEQRMIDGDRR